MTSMTDDNDIEDRLRRQSWCGAPLIQAISFRNSLTAGKRDG
jgi:hypothetical protein